jgi:hypothetical protein
VAAQRCGKQHAILLAPHSSTGAPGKNDLVLQYSGQRLDTVRAGTRTQRLTICEKSHVCSRLEEIAISKSRRNLLRFRALEKNQTRYSDRSKIVSSASDERHGTTIARVSALHEVSAWSA